MMTFVSALNFRITGIQRVPPLALGLLMRLLETVVSGHCGVRGKERPHLQLPPPSRLLLEEVFGCGVCCLDPPPLPLLPFPILLLPLSSPPPSPPPSTSLSPSLPPSPSTSRRCKPLAEKLEGHPRKCKKKRHLDISQNIISRLILTVLFLHSGLLPF